MEQILYKSEIHRFKKNGHKLTLDVRNLNLFKVDDISNDILCLEGYLSKKRIINMLSEKYKPEKLNEAIDELLESKLLNIEE